MKAFASYSRVESHFVLQVIGYLQRHFDVVAYELHRYASSRIRDWIVQEVDAAEIWLMFVGDGYESAQYQKFEAELMSDGMRPGSGKQYLTVVLNAAGEAMLPGELQGRVNVVVGAGRDAATAERCAQDIIKELKTGTGDPMIWKSVDGLPVNPHLFSYEKDIINFFDSLATQEEQARRGDGKPTDADLKAIGREEKLADGCPASWPEVVDLSEEAVEEGFTLHGNPLVPEIGEPRDRSARVAARALIGDPVRTEAFSFHEAGPRSELVFPIKGRSLRIGILVSGGIAPGINAVIDGIVQRHFQYDGNAKSVTVLGYTNGFRGLKDGPTEYSVRLCPTADELGSISQQGVIETSEFADKGGAMFGTYRMNRLIDPSERLKRLRYLASRLDETDILYMIGGDGTMKAAHALYRVALERVEQKKRDHRLSVIAVPNTMDNDILWVWQSFGFMSAVEKCREFVESLHTEVASNPRLCVLQLFGSDSGFVVSHAVLASSAGHCDLALIPEVDFSLLGVADHLATVIERRRKPIPRALIAMAETALPVEVSWYVNRDEDLPAYLSPQEVAAVEAVRDALSPEDPGDSPLTSGEVEAIREFDQIRKVKRRIQGQVSDELRRAGLKVLLHGLEAILKQRPKHDKVQWNRLRMLANEPRHLVRAIPPSPSDIIMGQRLGSLAVDNAMAGYTDFMISQWLTEYVLVPLRLVVLGRKRIPDAGIFWKSVLAKTGQPEDLAAPWRPD